MSTSMFENPLNPSETVILDGPYIKARFNTQCVWSLQSKVQTWAPQQATIHAQEDQYARQASTKESTYIHVHIWVP